MSWPESKFVIDKIKDKITSMSIAPRKANSVSATYDKDTKIVTLTIGDSDPVYIDTYPSEDSETPERSEIVRTAQYEIWKRLNEEISSYGEGEKIATINKKSNIITYEDDVSDIEENTVFHYAVFSISDKEGINSNEFIKTYCLNYLDIFNVYGFKQDFNILDSDQTITYPTDLLIDPNNSKVAYSFINANYDQMNIKYESRSKHKMNPGDYMDFLNRVIKNKPYMVKASDKKADYQLSLTDYSKKYDNVSNSDFSNSSYNGGPFAWINKIYSKEIYDDVKNVRIVMFSSDPNTKDVGFKPTGFINPSNQELEGVWIPMCYTNADGKMYGLNTAGSVSQTTANQKISIEKLTSDAKFFGGPILNILRDIEYMLFKTTDIQAHAGYGRCYGYNSNYPSEYKQKYSINNQNLYSGCKYTADLNGGTGYEEQTLYDEYGTGFMGTTFWESSEPKIKFKSIPNKMFHSQVLGSYNIYIRDPYTLAVNGTIKVSPNYTYDITGDSYVDTGKTYSANKSGYPVKLFPTEAGSLPDLDDTSGSTTTGSTCDYAYVNVSGVRVGLRLGAADSDLRDGPSCLHLNNDADHSYSYIGFATLLLPDPGYSPE